MKKFKGIKRFVVATVIATSGVIGVVGAVGAANVEARSDIKDIMIEGKKVTIWESQEWAKVNGHWHFVKDYKVVKGWRYLDKYDGEDTPHWSYFDNNGRLYTGWHKMGKTEGEKVEHWSYFGPNGWLRTGWQQMGKGTNNPDGNTAKHVSYFGPNGWLRTGMVTLGKSDGEKVTHKSYFGGNGWLVANKRFSVSGKTYTADSRGWVK